jgi:hypothetical protein
MTLLEPDVALTDYGLAAECAVLVWLLRRERTPGDAYRLWFSCFFAAVGVAALLGGTVHGLIADRQSVSHGWLWSGTLLAIGFSALAGWALGARLMFPERCVAWIVRSAVSVYAVYAAIVIAGYHSFVIAIVHYLPAALFLLTAFLFAWRRDRSPLMLVGALGMVLTFIASGVQQAQIGLHARYFNHNALYHLIEAVALVLLYLPARSLVRR